MNGSVASSSSLLARLVWPVLARTPLRRPERATALIAVAATLGVVLPPSLVLLLLGDALMRAHTEALQLHPERPWTGGHVLNTQDLLHAAALPAGLVLQASFLWPPMGYAVMLARLQGPSIGTWALWRALAPYLLVQALCIVGVFCWPASVHGLDEGAAAQAPGAAPAASAPMSEDDIEARMRAMSGNSP